MKENSNNKSIFIKGALGTGILLVVGFILHGCLSHAVFSSKQKCLSITAKLIRPRCASSGNSAESTPTIRIGMVISQTGELAQTGVECLKAARLAVEEINQQGGIHGKKIELLAEDSGAKPEQGKSAAEKLIAKGVIGIVGDISSGTTAQMGHSAFEKGIPVISVGATSTELTNIGSNMFRVCFTDDVQGKIMARFAYEILGMKRAAILTDKKQPYSVGLSDSFRKSFEKFGGKVVDHQYYESKQIEFSAQLTNMKVKNPDCLFLGGYYPEVGPIARQAHSIGLNLAIIGGDGWEGDQILTAGGKGILGSYFCTHFHTKDPRPEVQHYVKAWTSKYGRIPQVNAAALSYDAIYLIRSALEKAKNINSRELIMGLDQTENFPGATGNITLKGNNGNPAKGAVIVEVTPSGSAFRKFYAPGI